MPFPLTFKNHRSRWRLPSGCSCVMGYALITVQSATDRVTSSCPLQLILVGFCGSQSRLTDFSSGYRRSICGRIERGRKSNRAVDLSWTTSASEPAMVQAEERTFREDLVGAELPPYEALLHRVGLCVSSNLTQLAQLTSTVKVPR